MKRGEVTRPGRPARPRTLRHLHAAERRCLVVLAGRLVHRPHRPPHRRVDGCRAADREAGGARRVWGDSRGHTFGSANGTAATCPVYDPVKEDLAHPHVARQCAANLCRLCRRARQGLGQRLRRQRRAAVRSDARALRALRAFRARPRTCARSSVGRARSGAGKRHRAHLGDPDRSRSVAPAPRGTAAARRIRQGEDAGRCPTSTIRGIASSLEAASPPQLARRLARQQRHQAPRPLAIGHAGRHGGGCSRSPARTRAAARRPAARRRSQRISVAWCSRSAPGAPARQLAHRGGAVRKGREARRHRGRRCRASAAPPAKWMPAVARAGPGSRCVGREQRRPQRFRRPTRRARASPDAPRRRCARGPVAPACRARSAPAAAQLRRSARR